MKNIEIPKKGIAGLKAHYKDDLLAGFSVSLIALPLCLGIAIASGVPPLAGLITAIVGGIVASRISGSFVTISGPAAGLIVITLGAAESMGGAGLETHYAGYPHALGAIVIGGLIMALFGLLKVGKVGDFFPSAAVHGMLAAIGVIIIIKQFYPAIGAPSAKGEILEVAAQIPNAFGQMNIYALTISLISLAILILHPILKSRVIKAIPAPMWVLIIAIPLAAMMGSEHLSMVQMPHNLLGEDGFKLPSFAKIGESAFWVAVIGFALVSAIESLLSAKAVDSLDPYKRPSNLDKDLVSMGAGSSLAALIGGLPMISEIVRSSANVNNGAKSQWANFFHGVLLLVYLLLGVTLIEMIPISALAAMLVFTGFKLASPKEFKHMYQIGLMDLEVFVVTLVAVLATDLIIGIAIGIAFKYALLLFKGTKLDELFKTKISMTETHEAISFNLEGAQIFSNYLSLKKQMDQALGRKPNLVLDFSKSTFIDHTVMEHLEDYVRLSKMKGKEVSISNIDVLNPLSNHPLAARDKKLKLVIKDASLSGRSIALFSYANINNYRFSNKVDRPESWQFYDFTIRKKWMEANNVISFYSNDLLFEIADIVTQTGADISADIDRITALKIKGLPNVPKFYMHKRSIMDTLHEFLENDEIKFSDYPEFSDRYALITDGQEKEVRDLLNFQLLSFLEEERNIFMSGNGEDLLIHLENKLLDVKEIDNLIHKAKDIISLIEFAEEVLRQ